MGLALYKPDKTRARSAKTYYAAWRELAEPIEKLTGAKAWAYDPGISFSFPDGTGFDLSAQAIRNIIAHMEDNP